LLETASFEFRHAVYARIVSQGGKKVAHRRLSRFHSTVDLLRMSPELCQGSSVCLNSKIAVAPMLQRCVTYPPGGWIIPVSPRRNEGNKNEPKPGVLVTSW